MLAHDIHDSKIFFSKPDSYESVALIDACLLTGLEGVFRDLLVVTQVFGAKSVKSPKGIFCADELLKVHGLHLSILTRRNLPLAPGRVSPASTFDQARECPAGSTHRREYWPFDGIGSAYVCAPPGRR